MKNQLVKNKNLSLEDIVKSIIKRELIKALDEYYEKISFNTSINGGAK